MKRLKKYLINYILVRTNTNPQFHSYIKWQYIKRSFLILLLFPFRKKYEPVEILLSGNGHQRFYKDSDGLGTWGISTLKFKPSLDIGLLYVAVTLYAFISRRYVFLLRHQITKIRNEVRDAPPRYVVMHSDGLPLARALILALRPIKTKFLCVQHGLFHSALPGEIDGVKCDYNVIIRPDQLQYFRDSGVSNLLIWSEIVSDNFEKSSQPSELIDFNKVVLVGEALFTVSKSIDQKALIAYRYIKDRGDKLGYDVRYRLHPSEKKSFFKRLVLLYYFGCPDQSEEIIGRLFVGYNSSFLDKVASRAGAVCNLDLEGVTLGSKKVNKLNLEELIGMLKKRNFQILSKVNVYYSDVYDIKLVLNEIKIRYKIS